MSYSFRIRVNRAAVSTISTDALTIIIPTDEDGITLSFQASTPEKSIKDADQWAFKGEGYQSADAALQAGTRHQDAFMLACAKTQLGVDFGLRTPSSFMTKAGEEFFTKENGRRTINNNHGLMVFETEPKPLFQLFTMTPSVGREAKAFEATLHAAIALQPKLSDRERLAISLFSDSFFQPSDYSRFLLLVMAIEAMIEPLPKTPEAVKYVTSFMKAIEDSALGQDEKNSLLGSLKWLGDESIGKAGRRLIAERLGNELYLGKSAPKFFSDVYTLRSRLVHGSFPTPTFAEISGTAAILQGFVSDLLTVSLHKTNHPDVFSEGETR